MRSDPRMCVWKSGKAFPSPNIATHRGKAVLPGSYWLSVVLTCCFLQPALHRNVHEASYDRRTFLSFLARRSKYGLNKGIL